MNHPAAAGVEGEMICVRFASSIVGGANAEAGIERLLNETSTAVTAGMVDLALFFVTAHFEDDLENLVQAVSKTFPHAAVVGCTGEGTIGLNREIERSPSMSLIVGCFDEVEVRPFHLTQNRLEGLVDPAGWERALGVSAESRPVFLAFADPFRLDVQSFLDSLNMFYPGSPVVGGMTSAGSAPGQNRLIAAGRIVREGVVGASLTGRIDVGTIVSQGCRPIGQPLVVTKGRQNVVFELGGKPALQRLHEVIVKLDEHDRKLAEESLLLGRVIDEYKRTFRRGDFLVHNIIGADRKSGAMAITGYAKVGATVQFHVRDAATADEDLHAMLAEHAGANVRAALLFGCNGRGSRMWPQPGHDAGVLHQVLGDVPVGGFFCGGEFGPIGGKNFIHGFTASIALFREPPASNVDAVA